MPVTFTVKITMILLSNCLSKPNRSMPMLSVTLFNKAVYLSVLAVVMQWLMVVFWDCGRHFSKQTPKTIQTLRLLSASLTLTPILIFASLMWQRLVHPFVKLLSTLMSKVSHLTIAVLASVDFRIPQRYLIVLTN